MINLSDRERELIDSICTKKRNSAHKQKSERQSQEFPSPNKFISSSSSKILVSRLERKLNETLNQVDEEQVGQLTYQQLGRVFTLLDIFQATSYNQDLELELQGYNNPLQKQTEINLHDKAWLILSNQEDSVDIQAAFCFFRIILDPNFLEPSKSTLLIKEYLDKVKAPAIFDEDSIYSFCKDFQLFQKSRLANAKTGYLKPTLAQDLIEIYEKNLTFKPVLDPISEALQSSAKQFRDTEKEMASQYLSQSVASETNTDRVTELYRKKEISNKKIDFLKQERLIRDMQECTFKPKIKTKQSKGNNFVDRLYQVKNRQSVEDRVKQQEREREDEEFSKCSFHPRILGEMPEPSFSEIKGFNQSVQRVRTALDRRHLQEMKLNHKPVGEKYEIVKELPFSPPEMLSRGSNKKELPILFIDVKIGPSKVGRLAIRKNDDIQTVVDSFVKVWGIGQNEHDLLLEQVSQHLEQIVDEENQ